MTQILLSLWMFFALQPFHIKAADLTGALNSAEAWKGNENNVTANLLTPIDRYDVPTGRDIMKESPFEMFAQILDDTGDSPDSMSSMLKPYEFPEANGDVAVQTRSLENVQALEENLVRVTAFRNDATVGSIGQNSPYKTFNSVSRPSIIPSQEKVRVRLTFYSGQDDRWGDRVAWDKVNRAKKGRTVAADPAIFPYGTWLNIPGFGNMRVEDTGSAVKARVASGGKDPVVDVYVAEEKEVNRLSSLIPEYVEVKYLGGR